MSWDDFVAVATAITYWTGLWVLASVPAALAIFAIGTFFPTRPDKAAAAINAHSPALSDASTRFRNALTAARERLNLGTVRVLLDRKFLRLRRDLTALRKVLDDRLAQITYASKTSGGTSLIQLLENFSNDTDRAQAFNEIDDDLVDHSKTLSSAKMRYIALSIFAIVIAAVNFGLLYLFFDTMFDGLTVPFINIELAMFVAILFPLLELSGGIGSEFAKEKSDGPGTKLIIYSAVAFLLLALGTLEYVIFHELLAGAFEAQSGFEKNGFLHGLVALVGPALTVFEALAGFGIARNVLVMRELGPVRTIKDHVSFANRFVDGLDARFSEISMAATQARQSVSEFAEQLHGRDEAQLPVASAIAEEREKFLKAIDAVGIGSWSKSAAPSPGDVDAVTSYSWALALGVLFCFGVFCFVFTPEIERSLRSTHSFALALSAAAALVPLLVGGNLFDRATSSVGHELEWRDVFSPRDGAFKIVAIGALGFLTIGILWICFDALGAPGFGKAAILLALTMGLAWASSYLDLMVRGIAFLGAVLGNAFAWLLRTTINLVAKGLIAITALLIGLVLALLNVLAWPFTLAYSFFKAPRSALGGGEAPSL